MTLGREISKAGEYLVNEGLTDVQEVIKSNWKYHRHWIQTKR